MSQGSDFRNWEKSAGELDRKANKNSLALANCYFLKIDNYVEYNPFFNVTASEKEM